MAFRVNPDLSTDLLSSIQLSQSQVNAALQQIATGRRVNSLSDDPAASAAVMFNHAQSANADQYLSNINTMQGLFQITDSTLSSAVNLMAHAVQLGVQGANGTLNDSDRQAIATEVSGLQQQMLSLSNLSYQGSYVFAGTNVHTQPFTLDPNSASGVTYSGNTNVNSVDLLNGQQMTTNVPGSQIFLNPAGSIFGTLQNLLTALQTNTNIGAASTALQTAASQLYSQRVFYGNGMQQMESATLFLNQEKVELSTQENTLVGADLAKAATNLTQAQASSSAVLTATGKILNRNTLFDYLK
jgi:flagellar hook-associated protein 3 FlgL